MKCRRIKDFSRYLFLENGSIVDTLTCNLVEGRVKMPCGYKYVRLLADGEKSKEYRAHILICRAFNGPKPQHNSVVGHKDNNKLNNNYTNLYWTTTQENSQKACDDGCSTFLRGVDNPQSFKVKVMDKDTYNIVGVYGSIRDCCRYIENTSPSFISSMLRKGELYKPRTKRFIYATCTEECFYENSDLLNKMLQESIKVDKRPTIFKVTFLHSGKVCIYDNQTTFGKYFNIPQAIVSKLIRESGTFNNMKFELVKKEEVVNTSVYAALLGSVKNIKVQNIFTDEILDFRTTKELKEYFSLKGNDIRGYEAKSHLILGEWRILN